MESTSHKFVQKLTSSGWEEYFKLRERLCNEDNVTFHFVTISDFIENTISSSKKQGFFEYVIINEKEHIGRLVVNKKAQSNLYFTFHILKKFRNNSKHINYILKIISKKMEILNQKKIRTNTRIKSHSETYLLKGSKLFEVTNFFVLHIDRNLWITKDLPLKLNKIFRLEYCDFVPEKYIDKFVQLWNELKQDIPRMDYSKIEKHSINSFANVQIVDKQHHLIYKTILVFEKDTLVGLSYIFYNLNKPEFVYQKLTGIRKKYRRLGLGEKLKELMIGYIIEENHNVKEIKTASFSLNKPMIQLNYKLGFKKDYSIWHHEISFESL